MNALAPGGVDGVFDVVGAESLPELVKIASGEDRVVTIADYTAQQFGVRRR